MTKPGEERCKLCGRRKAYWQARTGNIACKMNHDDIGIHVAIDEASGNDMRAEIYYRIENGNIVIYRSVLTENANNNEQ